MSGKEDAISDMDSAKDVDNDEFDFAAQINWINSWMTAFFSLYCLTLAISLFFYLCLLRAMARNSQKETPTYFFVIFLFFTSLVEDALVVHQFVMIHHTTPRTTGLCQLFTYATYGNKLLQAAAVVALIYYTWILVDWKKPGLERTVKRLFPMIVIGLLALEFVLTIGTALNVKGSKRQSFCYNVDKSWNTLRLVGWLYLVLFPFFIPLVACVYPCLRIAGKIRARDFLPNGPQETNAKLGLLITLSYFFFHLLYYMLMLARETEAMVLDRPAWRRLLGIHVWYLTRPMFSLIGYCWHVVIPLAPFVFDRDLMREFPGNWIHRKTIEEIDRLNRNSMSMEQSSGENSRANTASVVSSAPSTVRIGNQDSSPSSVKSRQDISLTFNNPIEETEHHRTFA